ncbi:MAG: glycosyltransferase family protein [Planctomycetota bacterium]|jgi:UDP:flavonoid glycosyltransferase YjiC (YdhE family)
MKILFGVFDWGLGHATRDIPLITALLKNNHVHIISTGWALQVLKGHFKDKCEYYDIPSVYPPYTRTPFFKLKFALYSPIMIRNLRHARSKSAKVIAQRFDKVISDCRYDVYDTPQNSYLINHQLRFKGPIGTEKIMEKWLASRTKMFKYVFVPDFDSENLSGRLSHNLRYAQPDKIRYVGILSQLQKLDTDEDIDYFISLSGPEPQRSVFERKVFSQLNLLDGKIVIAGGNPAGQSRNFPGNIEHHSYLNAAQQQNFMNRAKFIIARPGYTSIMEFAELGKTNVLLVPTPSQTEQEYLADYWERKKYYHHVSQYRLKLKRDIRKSKKFHGFNPPWRTQESVRRCMEIINT